MSYTEKNIEKGNGSLTYIDAAIPFKYRAFRQLEVRFNFDARSELSQYGDALQDVIIFRLRFRIGKSRASLQPTRVKIIVGCSSMDQHLKKG